MGHGQIPKTQGGISEVNKLSKINKNKPILIYPIKKKSQFGNK